MSFGGPSGKHGKFYSGVASNTPVNNDLLWRARVTSEVGLMEQAQRAKDAATVRRHRFTSQDADRLLQAIAKHGRGNWGAIQSDPEFKQLVDRHGIADLEYHWASIAARAGSDINRVLEKAVDKKKDVVPFGSGVGPLGTELALRHEVQQRKQLTARMDDKLRKQRIGRLRAEKKLALEMRETRALEAELERLQASMSPSSTSSKHSSGRLRTSGRHRIHGGAAVSPITAPKHKRSSPSSPLRYQSSLQRGGALAMRRTGSKKKLTSEVVDHGSAALDVDVRGDVHPARGMQPWGRADVGRSGPKARRNRTHSQVDRQHVYAISYLIN